MADEAILLGRRNRFQRRETPAGNDRCPACVLTDQTMEFGHVDADQSVLPGVLQGAFDGDAQASSHRDQLTTQDEGDFKCAN
jgi:hypothetical protein